MRLVLLVWINFVRQLYGSTFCFGVANYWCESKLCFDVAFRCYESLVCIEFMVRCYESMV